MCIKGEIKKENIYIIETGLCQERMNFFVVLVEKTMYTRKKSKKHTATRQQLWRKLIDGKSKLHHLTRCSMYQGVWCHYASLKSHSLFFKKTTTKKTVNISSNDSLKKMNAVPMWKDTVSNCI